MIPGTGMKVVLEVFFMTLSAPASIRYVVRRMDISTRGLDPDDGVLQLIAEAKDDGIVVKREQCFIHSTSWRYEPERTIVLTYLAYSDYMALPDKAGTVFQPADVPLATSAEPDRPRPNEVREEQVAAHAFRHLSFLVKNGRSAVHDILGPDTQRFLMAINDLPAGKFGVNMPVSSGAAATTDISFHPVKAIGRTPEKGFVRIEPRID